MIPQFINSVVTIYMVVMQAIDLHTTSEAIKRGVGKEDNEVLAGLLNTDEQHAKKFWRLVVFKIVGALISIGIGVLGWFVSSEEAVVIAVIHAALAIYYTKIMINNWKLYRRVR